MKRLAVIFFIILFTVAAYAGGIEPNWYRIDNNNYYDPETVVDIDSGYSFLLKAYNKGQYEPVNGRKILYTLSHYEINCQDVTYKIGVMDSYDKEDGFVNGDYNRYSEFQPVVEGSAVGYVFKKLCRQ